MTTMHLLAAVVLLGTAATPIRAQQQGERKVRIEISRIEDGQTSSETREFELGTGEDLEQALRDLGVWDELRAIGAGEDLYIDLRRTRDGGALDEMALALSMAGQARDAVQDPSPRAFLGVHLAPYAGPAGKGRRQATVRGALISHVTEGSPARQAGLREGDVITAIDGTAMNGPADVTAAVRQRKPGDVIRITLLRDGDKREEKVTLTGRTDDEEVRMFRFDDLPAVPRMPMARPFLGVNGGSPEEGGQGAGITSVVPGSAAEAMGLRAGDRIVAINGHPIGDFAALSEHIATMEAGAEVEVTVLRDGQRTNLNGTLGERTPRAFNWAMPSVPPMSDEDRAALRRDMDELRRDMDRLRREIRGEVLRELRVTVEATELSEEDKALLRNNGVAGIDRELKLEDLRIAPNPADGFFRIHFTAPDRGDLTVDVHDASGERIYQERIIGFKGRYERTLDLSDRPAGTYFLVLGQHDRVVTRKLVKR